jgi:hypothetical protein
MRATTTTANNNQRCASIRDALPPVRRSPHAVIIHDNEQPFAFIVNIITLCISDTC